MAREQATLTLLAARFLLPPKSAQINPRQQGGFLMWAFKYTLAASALAAAFMASPSAAQVKVGAVLSVTGPASFLGDPEKKTLDMYVEEINAKGGVNGQKLQLILYDDAGD